MKRHFTKCIVCKACRTVFTITSAASKFCQNKDCQNKRRRDDYAAKKAGTGAYKRTPAAGSEAHLERAVESGE
jgi:hypothetical protein